MFGSCLVVIQVTPMRKHLYLTWISVRHILTQVLRRESFGGMHSRRESEVIIWQPGPAFKD